MYKGSNQSYGCDIRTMHGPFAIFGDVSLSQKGNPVRRQRSMVECTVCSLTIFFGQRVVFVGTRVYCEKYCALTACSVDTCAGLPETYVLATCVPLA